MKKNYETILGAIFMLAVLPGTSCAEITIGRWCDKSVPNMPQFNQIMEIVALDSGEVEVRYTFR